MTEVDATAVLKRFVPLETGWVWVTDAELAVIKRALVVAVTPKETSDELALAEHRTRALAESLGAVLVKLGIVLDVPLTGPELLSAAEQYVAGPDRDPRWTPHPMTWYTHAENPWGVHCLACGPVVIGGLDKLVALQRADEHAWTVHGVLQPVPDPSEADGPPEPIGEEDPLWFTAAMAALYAARFALSEKDEEIARLRSSD